MIAKIIDEYIAEKRKGYVKSGRWHISNAGLCHRKRFFNRKGYEETNPFDKRTLRVFECGHIFHKFITDALEWKGVLKGKEVHIKFKDRSGYCDCTATDDDTLVLFENKSQHSQAFKYLNGRAKTYHKMQAINYYTHLKKRKAYRNIKSIRIVYISKDDLRIEEIAIIKSEIPEIKRLIKEDWKVLRKYWKANTIPPAIPQEKWECKSCVFRDLCKEVETQRGADRLRVAKEEVKKVITEKEEREEIEAIENIQDICRDAIKKFRNQLIK